MALRRQAGCRYRSDLSPKAVLATLSAIEARFDTPVVFSATPDDDEMAAELESAYIAAANDNYFPLPTEFEMSEEEMHAVLLADFLGFIQEWRKRTIAARELIRIAPTIEISSIRVCK